MKDERLLVDTTLRDGEQSPGYAMTREEKTAVARLLDRAGVYQIEAGIPAIGSYEKDTILAILQDREHAKISTWNRMNPADIRHSFDCAPDIVHVGVPVSYAQIYTKLHKNKTWIQKTAMACVGMALEKGFEVTVGFEDASRADPSFLLALAAELGKLGVRRVRLADTVGVLNPSRAFHMVSELISYAGVEVEIHAHNDLGMAVANSLAAAKAGAKYIDTTVFGIGERAGNCDMKQFISVVQIPFSVAVSRAAAVRVEQRTEKILLRSRKNGNGA